MNPYHIYYVKRDGVRQDLKAEQGVQDFEVVSTGTRQDLW